MSWEGNIGGDPQLVGAAPSREPRRKREFFGFFLRKKGISGFFPEENGNFWFFLMEKGISRSSGREKGIAAFSGGGFDVWLSAGKRKIFLFQRKKKEDFRFS